MINKNIPFLLLLAALFGGANTAFSEVKLPPQFSDHLVLQRDMKVPIWGTADAGEAVTVKFEKQKLNAVADANGKWRVDLKPLKANAAPQILTVSGKTAIELKDVLVGEVWLCSGQSNMDFTVAKTEKYYFAGVNNEAAEVAAANYPTIRRFTGDWKRSYEPQTEVEGKWMATNPETVREFSAIGYFFARDLQKEIKVPVGIITLTFGASTAQAWIRREALAADSELKPMLDKFDADEREYQTNPAIQEKYQQAVKTWDADAAKAKADGKPAPRKPRNPDPVEDQHNPTVMFNGMIAPIIPFAIRGVLWYQGESITGAKDLFPKLNNTLITDWRKLWGEGDFPFYFVQLAPNKDPKPEPGESGIAVVREMQTESLALPNTAMALTIDIGDATNVHPKNKQDVGNRLAKIALAKVYGRKIEYSGPVFESMKVEGGTIRLKFAHADGLHAEGGALKYFAVAGADKKFVWADAKIEGNTVIVSSSAIDSPMFVRYAWADNPDSSNLYNSAMLPAAPFRTDKTAKQFK